MSKKDPKKDVSHVEEVNLDAIVGTDTMFDLGKIREKAVTKKDASFISIKKEVSYHDDGEEEEEDHIDSSDIETDPTEDDILLEDDILPIKDEDLLLLDDDLIDFDEDEDEDEDDEDEGENGEKKKRKK
jgi:hypothetical protein